MGLNFQLAIVSNHLICFALDNSIFMPCSICCSAVYRPIDHRSLISSSIFFIFSLDTPTPLLKSVHQKSSHTDRAGRRVPIHGQAAGSRAPPNDPEVNPWVKFQNLRPLLTHQFSILFKKTLHYFFINIL